MNIVTERPSVATSAIDRDTIRAYRETHYRVFGETPMTLRVGEVSSLLAAQHRESRVQSSAFVTAGNPHSRVCDVVTNATRQRALERELRWRSLTYIAGVGEHPSQVWNGEASFLVLGLSLEAAKALGERHDQNAIIWSGSDALPLLILLR